jgi:hypothetical protein
LSRHSSARQFPSAGGHQRSPAAGRQAGGPPQIRTGINVSKTIFTDSRLRNIFFAAVTIGASFFLAATAESCTLRTKSRSHAKGAMMARKPNYSFEKRQKELARQAKKEEKKQRKLTGQSDPDDESPEEPQA